MKHYTPRQKMVATESRKKSVMISQIASRILAVPILICQKKTQRELRKKALMLKCLNKTERQTTLGACHVKLAAHTMKNALHKMLGHL